jgi:hypothetical protein
VLRAIGVVLFLGSLALPVHGCVSHPRDYETPPQARALPEGVRIVRRTSTTGVVQPGWRGLEERATRGWRREGAWGALWESRAWYPYYLAPLWLAALLAARSAPRSRRSVARGLLFLSGVVASFEFVYLWSDYDGFLGPSMAKVEKVLAWVVVAGVLFWRPARRSDSIGATISAQALLAFLHAFVFPLQDVRFWSLQGYGPGAMVRAILANYRIGFWVAVAGLAAVAVPGYAVLLRRRARGPGPEPLPTPPAAESRDLAADPAEEAAPGGAPLR